MPQWIVDLVGEGLAPIVWVAIVAVIVCGLAMAMIVLAKKAFGGRIGTQFKGRAPRLAVMDVTRIDEKRKLVLVRRDEIEHLILIGGQNDVLLEGNILRVPAAARPHGDWNTSRSDEIEEERFARNHRHEPELPAVAERTRAPEPRLDAPAPRETKPTPPERAEPPSPEVTDRRSPSPVATPSPLAAASLATAATGAAANGAAASVAVDSPSPDTRRPAAAAMPEPVAPPAPPKAPVAARPVAQPRSMATPTATRAPDIGPATAQQDTAAGPAPASRVEPRFAAARSQPEPSTPDSETARTQLRAQMNRSQSPEFSRVQDATAPAIAVEPADAPVAARQPLSVRSFASAIQQRKAPPEMPPPATPATPAPTPRPAPAAPASAAPASASGRGAATAATASAAAAAPSFTSSAPEPETPKPEVTPPAKPEAPAAPASAAAKASTIEAERADPSLEDFLSAELDTDFGDDDGDEDVAPPRGSVPAPTVDVPVTSRPERAPESRDVPKVDATSRSSGASTWPQAPTPVVAKAEDAKPSSAPAPSIDAPSREPAASPRPMPEPARVEPETRADRDTADESAPDAPATGDQAPERRLTLEEEMERLLGDFSFDAKGERKPN